MEKIFSVKEVSYKSWQRRERREGNIPEGKVLLWWQWYRKGSGTVVAAVPWWGGYCRSSSTVVAVGPRWWYNRLNRRGMFAETQTVGKGIEKPVYRQIFCVQYSCVTSSAHFCEGFFSSYFFVIFFSVFRLAFSAASQPSIAHPIATQSTHACGETARRVALLTVLEMMLTVWQLLAVL